MLGIVIGALTVFLNLTTRGFGLDTIILFFWFIAALKNKGKEFIKDWWIYLVLFWAYETSRGIADNIGNVLHRPLIVDFMIHIDKLIFGTVPTVWLQHILPPSKLPYLIALILFIIYTTFYWYWAGIGYILWLKNKKLFKDYMNILLIVSFIASSIYALFPSAPPWYAASIGKLPPLNRFLWGKAFPKDGISFVHFWDQNYFAAFPSLHFSWPFLASIFLIYLFAKNKKYKKIAYISLIIPFAICFAIVYGAEHYIADCLAGGILVAFVIWGYNTFTKGKK